MFVTDKAMAESNEEFKKGNKTAWKLTKKTKGRSLAHQNALTSPPDT